MKMPFWKASRKSSSEIAFSYVMQGETLSLTLRKDGVEQPVAQWSNSLPEVASTLAELIALACEGTREDIIIGESEIRLTPAAVANLRLGTAAALGLPPPTALALDVKPVGGIAEDGFHLKTTWIRLGGQPILAKLDGALLKADGSVWRVPEPLWSLYRIAQRLSVPLEKAERFQVLSDLKALWTDDSRLPVRSDAYLKDIRVHYAAAMSLKLRTLTPETTEFDPVLFGASTLRAAADEGTAPDEEWDNLLSPRAQKLFAEDRFRREPDARPVYVLKDGEYIFIDPELRPILKVVRRLQDRPETERRDFVLNPRTFLREKLGENLSASASLENLFIETEQFSQRVAGVDIWRKTVLPWILPSGDNKWLPEKFGLKVADDYYTIAPQNVSAIVERFEDAHIAQHPTVDATGYLEPQHGSVTAPVVLPVNDQTRTAISSLAPFATAAAEEGVAETDLAPTLLAAKVFLVVKENFEEVEYASPITTVANSEVPASTPVALPVVLKTTLKPHQKEGLDWLVNSLHARQSGVLLADDMGLGKTLQAIAFMAWLRESMARGDRPLAPLLIVAPTGLLGNWRAEILKHLTSPHLGRLVSAFGGDLKRLKEESGLGLKDIETGRAALDSAAWSDAGVVLTTYETLRDYHFSFARSRFALIVYDEIQKLKNPVSQMTRAAKALNADFILGMTGTPVENRLQDLWSIMDVISPGVLGSSRDFEKRYPPTDAERLQALKSLLTLPGPGRKPHMLRRMKSEALKGLPAKTIHAYQIDMPQRQAKAYADLVMRAAAGAASGTLGPGGMLQILANMRGVSLHPLEPTLAPDNLDEYARDSARLSKALEILDDVCAKKEKALIFVEDLAMQERLAGLIYRRFGLHRPPARIHGGVPGLKRQEMVTAFQAEVGTFGVMILSPKAGGVGLTLTSANHVIHLSRWWNPAVEDQATDRVFRIGQTRTVHVHLPLAVHPDESLRASSFDLRLNALLERKRKLTYDLFMPPQADDGDLGELFNDVVAIANISEQSELLPSNQTVAENIEKPERPLLTLKGVVRSGARVWRVAAGKPKPAKDIFALFSGKDIGEITIRDPYALASERAIDAQIAFIVEVAAHCRTIKSIAVEYRPDLDDMAARKSFGEKFSAKFPAYQPALSLQRRARRSSYDDFHDRSVALTVKNASGSYDCHELLIGRGVEALFNDKMECTVTYSPPTS